MFPGERRPAGGIGRDADVCAGCGKKVTFYYQVGDMNPADCRCPECAAPMRLAGFRSWEKDGLPPEEKENLPGI